MKRIPIILLLLIIFFGFVVRLYRLDSPIGDWHSWRQSDTSSVSRNFAEKGFDLLHPTYMDLSNVPSGLDNPNGYRFVEFPIYNLFQAGLFKALPVFPLEQWGRLVTIIASCFSILLIYKIVKNRAGVTAALFSSFFFAFLPFSIYFGRTILPDESMVVAILAGIYFFHLSLKEDFNIVNLKFLTYFTLSIIFTAASFLLKPYALFFTLPIIYLAFEKYGISVYKKWQLYVFAILTLLPLILWRTWMTNFPEGIPASDWLFNGGNIRFKFSYFHWVFGERISKLILGYWGVSLLVLGIISKIEKRNLFYFLSFLFSSLIYLVVIARGNVQHDYYQILIIPSLCIFLGLGASALSKTFTGKALLPVIILFTFIFSWYFVRDFFNINNSAIISAGQYVDSTVPKSAKIIANYNGDTSLLYQTKRAGWASMEKPLPEMVKMGAGYLLLVNPKQEDYGLSTEFKLIKDTPDFLLFDLTQK